jgi:nickel-dependent lactate racemase
MRVDLAYGRTTVQVELPDGLRVDVVEKHPLPPLADPDRALREGLRRPARSRPLREIAQGRRDAVIAISDHTRPAPNALMLPPILDALSEGGMPPDAVTIQVATGLHRASTPAELDEILGTEIARSMNIVQHDARDEGSHADLGSTRGGIPILIDRLFLKRDLRIVTGLIEPHLMAGFSGGRKTVAPGLAAVETARVAHSPAMLEANVGPGIVEGNPLHAGLLEIANRVGVDFLVNVAINRERRISAVACGQLEAAHSEGMRFVEHEAGVALDSYPDLVITSGGGYPLDATFYQAIKGFSTASTIVRPGGVILLCAALSEGVGSAPFAQLLRECESPSDFERRLADDGFFAIDQWMVQHLCQAHRRARVLLYSDGVPPPTNRELLVETVDSPADGIERALAELGPNPRVAVLPQGPYVLATVRGKKRPLGGPAAWKT